MVQIKETNIIKVPPVKVDPQFFIPDDVVDVFPADESDLIPDDPLIAEEGDASLDDGGDDTSASGDPEDLPAPQTMTVFSQTLRVASDGKLTVDVVIDVEDVAGAINYEVRVTK